MDLQNNIRVVKAQPTLVVAKLLDHLCSMQVGWLCSTACKGSHACVTLNNLSQSCTLATAAKNPKSEGLARLQSVNSSSGS